MKDQMQYIVIEGRKPQDGAKPTQALLILPKWISPTLACAGIVGRVIELTDGNVIEQGALPMSEQEVLAELREDARSDAESQQEQELQLTGSLAPADDFATSRAEAMEPIPQAPADAAQQRDDAYREGMQAARTAMVKRFTEYGMPEGAGIGEWFKTQMEELAQARRLLKAFEGGATRQAYDETLAKLQAAEDNLDAWRDAAGAAGLGQECDEKSGQIKRLFVVPGLPANDMDLNTLCGAYGCLPGEDRIVWLQRKLNELVQAHGELGDRDEELSQLRQGLDKIRKTAKKALR